jgi:3-hydroxyisobutyrate dehydrogenase-like beta-hydroxyacid dehydrogenase
MNATIIGFVGLGRIGRPMAERLAAAGFDLVAYDIDRGAMQALGGRARLADSPADVADRCDIVIACLQTVAQYRAAVLGPRGIAEGRRAKTYLHVGTTGRECVREIARALAAKGIATLDAPMSGGVAGAREGRLVSMVAGPREVFDRAAACIASWSQRTVYLGSEPGIAQTMKLVNNMISAANLAVAAEAMVVGAKAGLPADVMLDVLNHGTGRNSATVTKVPNNILSRRFDCGSTLDNVRKDLTAYAEEARRAGLESAVCDAILRCFLEAGAQESMDIDMSKVVRPFERAAGVELRHDET